MGWRNRVLLALETARDELEQAWQAATIPDRGGREADADEIVLRVLDAQRELVELLVEMTESCSMPGHNTVGEGSRDQQIEEDRRSLEAPMKKIQFNAVMKDIADPQEPWAVMHFGVDLGLLFSVAEVLEMRLVLNPEGDNELPLELFMNEERGMVLTDASRARLVAALKEKVESLRDENSENTAWLRVTEAFLERFERQSRYEVAPPERGE